MSEHPKSDPQDPTPDPQPDPPPSNEPGSSAKSATAELKEGLFKMLGAARRLVDELPTKPLEDLVLRGADAAKDAAKQVTKDLPTERIAASPTYQRIETAVKTGAREVSRAVENVASTAWDNVRGVKHESAPPSDPAAGGERIQTDEEDPGPRG